MKRFIAILVSSRISESNNSIISDIFDKSLINGLKGRQNSADAIRVTNIPGEQISNSYNILPEEAYCSALDINSSDDGPRFPWQCDVAIQCDLVTANTSSKTSKTGNQLSHITASLTPDQTKATKHEKIVSGIRFWKSSSILGPNNSEEIKKQSQQKKQSHHKSVLQRAASFDSRGYSRLIQTSSPNSPTLSTDNVGSHLYVPHHIQTLTPSQESSLSGSREGTPPPYRRDRRKSSGTISAPNSRSGTPPLTPPYTSYRGNAKVFNLIQF